MYRLAWGVMAGLFAPLALLVLSAQPASAAVTCDPATDTVSIGGGETVTIIRDGDNISVPICSPGTRVLGTVSTVDVVTVTGSPLADALVIDLSGGTFSPGLTVVDPRVPEVEFDIDLGTQPLGGSDTLTIVGSPGADTIIAGSGGIDLNGDDDVDAGSGCTPAECTDAPADVEEIFIDGGAGDDSMSAAGSAGTGGASSISTSLDGGPGTNRLRFSAALDPVSANLVEGTATGATAVVNFTCILGTPFNDELTGDENDNCIFGLDGDDTIFGLGGNDLLDGDEGNDTIFGGAGADDIEGDEGDDTLHGGEGDDDIDGEEGADTLFGGDSDDTLEGAEGDDTLNGDASNDTLKGGVGKDIVNGGVGKDLVMGGADNDSLTGPPDDTSVDQVNGEGGTDTCQGPGPDRDVLVDCNP